MRGVASGRRWKKCVVEADLLGLGNTQTGVTTVTDRTFCMGETSIVNMVQRASKKVLLEPGDTELQWKGEAAASFVCAGITSSRVLPTSSAGYWSPLLSCFNTRPPKRRYPSGAISCLQYSGVTSRILSVFRVDHSLMG
jgi:hypothetical protein